MRINTFLSFSSIVVISLFVAVSIFVSNFIILDGIDNIENDQTIDDALKLKNYINHCEKELDKLTMDWAYWDDTYEYMNVKDEEFILKNFEYSIFEQQQISAAAIFDLDNKYIYGTKSAPQLSTMEKLSPSAIDSLKQLAAMLNDNSGLNTLEGVVQMDGLPYIFAVRKITDTLMQKEYNGILVFAKLIDNNFINNIGDNLLLTIKPVSPLSIDRELAETSIVDIFRIKKSSESIYVYVPIFDAFGDVALGLQMQTNRTVMQFGKKIFFNSLLLFIAFSAILIVAFMWTVRKRILSRIISLQSQLAGIKSLTDEKIKMNDNTADEIHFLANDINKMLAHIEDNELFLHQTINALHVGVVTISPDTHTILDVNDYAQNLIALPKDEIIGKTCHNFICPTEVGSCPITDMHQTVNLSVRKLLTGKKEIKPVLKSVHTIQKNGHEVLLETFIDISNVERLEQKLKESAIKYKSLFMNTGVATIVVNNGGKICMANSKFAALVEREIEDIEEKLYIHDFFVNTENIFITYPKSIKRNYTAEFETKISKHNGNVIDVHVSLARTADSSTFIISVFDTSERVQMELDLEYRATHDLLTGFCNKAFYKEKLTQMIGRAKSGDGVIAVLLMDLDRFKQVNDSFGHPAGDKLLQNVAERLASLVNNNPIIARTGGDEFMFILEGEDAATQAENLAKSILLSATQCFTVDNSQIYITASIGISLFPGDGLSADVLIKNADLAMYRSKERGKNAYTFFTKELDDAVNARFELETELFAAIEDENFEVFYQPKVDATKNTIVGCEALVRWKRADGHYVSPVDFISLAEETGLIVGIDRFVLQTVCKDLKDFSPLFDAPHSVAVNISARSIAKEQFVEDFLKTVDSSGVPHEQIGVEITETILMTDLETSIDSISRLNNHGFRIFLDDFGTGYSSLSYLHTMPISCLKIDKKFVDDIFSQQNRSDKIVTTIIKLASSLDVDVVAEGVETREQLEFLVKNRCNVIQGYFYSRPLPKKDYIEFCRNFNKTVFDS
ncbi:MAG: EAL domain-containing protein [Desulfovibrio sp.]|uniref:EAL domain-containing protein n=1 Tax=Desulfovibrio sp. TaxID=885 RepID=UPI00135ECD30|nr:EAL domain-containing protein [Desulfovibrio sp.]MTJ92754.1 EAL domain-containing protein [Desulfovibrio sp.]